MIYVLLPLFRPFSVRVLFRVWFQYFPAPDIYEVRFFVEDTSAA